MLSAMAKQRITTQSTTAALFLLLITLVTCIATELMIEAIDNDASGTGPWIFQGNERRFYR